MSALTLTGRIAVITGAARDIGDATAERVLRSASSVAIWDRNADKVESAAAQLASLGEVLRFAVELASHGDVQCAVRSTLERFVKIDILINNAGSPVGMRPLGS